MVAYRLKPVRREDRGFSILRVFLPVIGAACLVAIPGLWVFVPQDVPEVRVLGLAMTIMLIGISGLCFIGQR